jgi:acyl carrier protein
MSESIQIESKVRDVLGEVLLGDDASTIPANLPLWDMLDIDATDFKNFAAGLSQVFEVKIPQQDYQKLTTLAGCSVYIAKALASRPRPG